MKTPKAVRGPEPDSGAADAFMAKLSHPLHADIAAVRRIIRAVSPAITEEIKWNAPGFRTTESFATVNLRSTDRLQLVFHLGAKKRKNLPAMRIPAPAAMIKWLGRDRCLVTVGTGRTLAANQTALQALVRAWIRHV